MRLNICIGLLFVVLAGCSQKENPSKPVSIIPADSLVMILSDIQMIESAINIKQNEGRDVQVYSRHYYNYLYKKYKTDSAKIKSSIEFYQVNPEQLENIYKIVLDSLGKKQTELSNKAVPSVNRPQ